MQIYTLEQEKRGLCSYDDKRYVLADLHYRTSNPNTHAYGHHELATEVLVQMDMPEQSGTELVLEQQQPPTNDEPYHTSLQMVKRELQFNRIHDRVCKTLAKRGRRDSNGEKIGGQEYDQVPDDNDNDELDGAQLRLAERAAAARPGAATRIGDVIGRICARDNLRLPDSPPKRIHRQVRNEPVRALTDQGIKFCIILSVIYSQVRAEKICHALAPDPAASSTHPTRKTNYRHVHCRSATVLR